MKYKIISYRNVPKIEVAQNVLKHILVYKILKSMACIFDFLVTVNKQVYKQPYTHTLYGGPKSLRSLTWYD